MILVEVGPAGVLARDLGALFEQALGQRGRLQAQRQELVVAHAEVVLVRLAARVGQVGDLHAHHVADHLGQVEHPVRLGDLVQHPGPVAGVRRVADGQLDAPHGVPDVDERAGLAAGAVHGERVADGRLHEEPVQHGAVVAVVVEPVDQPLVPAGLVGLGAPHDALVQVGDAQPVVLRVEREHELVERLGHVVDRARVGRVQDLPLQLTVRGGHLDRQVALGDRRAARPAVAVDAHRAQVGQRGVDARVDQGGEQVVRGPHVVVHRVPLGLRGAHRVRRGALLGEVHDRVRAQFQQHRDQPVVLGGQVEVDEADLAAGHLTPDLDPLADRADRGQRLHLEVDVDLATAQVVDNGHVVATIRQIQRGRPAAEPVAAENQDAHSDSHHLPQLHRRPRQCRWTGSGSCRAAFLARQTVPWPAVYPPTLDPIPVLDKAAYGQLAEWSPTRQPEHPSQASAGAPASQRFALVSGHLGAGLTPGELGDAALGRSPWCTLRRRWHRSTRYSP